MWSDSASNVDLLGYEDLVAEIVDLTTDPGLQPLTVGAFADWGAGKSTLLQLCSKELQDQGAIVVEFSPWLVEGYDDVKSCLLGAVLDTIAASNEVGEVEKLGNLVKSLRGRINWMRLAKLGASAVVPIAGVALETLETVLDGQAEKKALASSSAVSAGFHSEFEALVGGLGNDQTVVVLIDDLDRCLPNQIIDTLEALRLFLAAPGTAFVIAADERLVRDAVRYRYSSAAAVEVDLPRDYLEKLVHVPLRIPPLTVPDAESYCNLLVAQLHLEPDDFDLVLSRATEIRSTGDLQVSCNVGISRDALGDRPLPLAAEEDFGLIAKVIQPLAYGLNGNPRQIKRFLNSMNIRRRTAARRDIDIDDVTLAKLGVLEYVRDAQFRELHQWQMNGGGVPEEITELETLSRDPEHVTTSAATGAWAADPWIREWLNVEPPLTGVDLSPYFFLSRDRLGSASVQANQLSPGLQVLAGRLGDEQSANSRGGRR